MSSHDDPWLEHRGRPDLAGVITGVWADTFDQHAFVASIVIRLLALVGGVFYSARSLGEPWSTLNRLDPIYYLVDATRAGFTSFKREPGMAVVVSVDDDTLITGMVAGGVPSRARALGSFAAEARDGYLGTVTSAVEQLTGKPPKTLRDVVIASREEPLAG
jgi:hypothetical protein